MDDHAVAIRAAVRPGDVLDLGTGNRCDTRRGRPRLPEPARPRALMSGRVRPAEPQHTDVGEEFAEQ